MAIEGPTWLCYTSTTFNLWINFQSLVLVYIVQAKLGLLNLIKVYTKRTFDAFSLGLTIFPFKGLVSKTCPICVPSAKLSGQASGSF